MPVSMGKGYGFFTGTGAEFGKQTGKWHGCCRTTGYGREALRRANTGKAGTAGYGDAQSSSGGCETCSRELPSIVADIGQPMKTYLKDARLSLGGDNKLLVVVKEGLASDYFMTNQKNKELLQRAVSEAVQKEIELEVQSLADNKIFEDSYIDLSKLIHMEIEIEDE